MRYQPVDLLGPSYADESRLWSHQDTVNWLPTVAEQGNTRTQVKLATPPGLAYFTQAGTGPIRGARNVEGRLFVVSGPTLYEISVTGVATSRGAIPGSGRVSMSHNKRGYGHQLLIVNSDAGYVFDTSANTLTKITDDGYPGAVMVDYLDHYLIQAEPFGRFWFHSEVDSAAEYNTLDRYDAEASTDKIVGIAANQLEAVVFSGSTTEFFTNTGAATGTFQSKRIVIERGCAARHSIVKIDNTLAWLGDDGIFYRLNGYGAVPISPKPIAQALAGLDLANCFGMVWEDKGYKVAYWTFPDGQTWGYDPTQPQGYQWHRRQSYGLDRWRLNTCTLWQGRWIGGDFKSGALFVLDWDAFHEVGQPLISERTGPTANDNQNLLVCPYVELIFDTGIGTGQIDPDHLPTALQAIGDVPDGQVGDAVTGAYTATGGVAPYTFALVSGTFPPGLTLLSDGTYTGTFTTEGEYTWTVRATDVLGATDDVPDTAEVIPVPWLIAYESSMSTTMEISPVGGLTWPNAGFAPSPDNWGPAGSASFSKHGDAILLCTIAPSPGTYGVFSDDRGLTWNDTNISLAANGGESCWCGGYWHVIAGLAQPFRSADGLSFANVATSQSALAIGTDGAKVVAIDGSGGVRVSTDAQASAWTGAASIPGGLLNDVRMGGTTGRVVAVGRRGLGPVTHHIYSSEDSAATWTAHTSPFPSQALAAYENRVRWCPGLDLWVATWGNRLAYGPDLDSLVLSARVFPAMILNVDADASHVFVCGAAGMLEHSDGADLETWIQATGVPGTAIHVVLSIGVDG